MFKIPRHTSEKLWVRYGCAVGAVAVAYLLRRLLTGLVGDELPTYVTFYPAVMVAALAGGLMPGLLATALTLAVVDYAIVTPGSFFSHDSPAETGGIVLFLVMGAFISGMTELYRRAREKAAAFEKELALRKSQEELRRQHEWLHVTLSSIGDAVLATDTAGRITLLNPVAQELTGWTEQEAIGQPVAGVYRLVHEETHAPVEDPVARVLRERRIVSGGDRTVLMARNGREIPVEHSAAPILEAPGKACGVVVVFQDVTEKRQAHKVVLQERDFMSAVLDTASALVVVFDTEGRIRGFNRACEQATGYSFKEVKGRLSWDFLLVPEEVASAKAVFAQLRAGQFPVRHENDWVTKGGERRRISWSNACVLDREGGVRFVVGTGIDITDLRLAEAALATAAEQRGLALAAGNLGLWDYDFRSGQVHWDERCWSMFGLAQGDRIDYRKAIAIIHEADRQGVEQAVQAALAPDSTGAYEREYRVIWPDGSVHWVAAKGQAYFQGHGPQRKPVRFVGTLQDITARRQAQETLTFLAKCGVPPGEDFFRSLARFLAETLRMDFICIDRLEGEALTAQTVAVFCDGEFQDNVSYALKDTPCGEVVGQAVCCFPSGVQERFPKDAVLQDLKAASYVGVTLFSSTGRPIGLIAVIGRRPLTNPRLAESVLQLVAGRAAGELERQQAERSLRDSQDRLLLAQQAGHVGVFDHDFRANKSFWSDECKALFGVPVSFEPTPESRSSFVQAVDRAAVQEELQRAFAARRREVEQTYRITRPDGQERWLEDRALVTYDAAGQPVRMVGTSTDVTAQVQAKERVRQRQRQFRSSAVRTVIILTLSIFLAEFADMVGLAHWPGLGSWRSGLLDSAVLVVLLSPVLYYFAYRPLLAMLQRCEVDEEALRRANESLEARVKDRTASLELANQKLESEVAERKRVEAALRESQAALQKSHNELEQRVEQRTAELSRANAAVVAERQRFRDVLDKLPAYLVVRSPDHRVVFANRFFEERFGKPDGRRCYEHLFHRTEPCENCENYKVLATREPHQWEWTGPDSRIYEIHNSPFVDSDGSLLILEVGLDISERKVADRERQNLRDELARVSRITTAGQLAASLAHELNQPLGAIACNVQAIQEFLIEKPVDHTEVQEALKDIEADSQRAGAVIHQLRGLYQKTGQGRTTLALNSVLRRTVDLLHSECVMKNVAVRLELDAQLPPVLGNQVELQQVMLNLITNAFEAMAARDPSARVLLLRTACDDPKIVRTSVRDSGTGLVEEQLGRIFDAFYTTKRTGMGMGLAISRSIVEAHGGRLWAEINPDQGATFHFTLPVFTGNA